MHVNAPVLSVITPAYNEAENLPHLHVRIREVLGAAQIRWEWIVVDDHSLDRTFEVTKGLAAGDPRVVGFRLARNSGSHSAIACGLQEARGDAAAMVAADLQDPPEVLLKLMQEWRSGAQVVWGIRARREGAGAVDAAFARLYYFIMRRLVGIRDMPPTGADMFLIDRTVVDALRQFGERHTSLLALITWMGFRQASVTYDKQPRTRGASGWSLAKKLKLVIDSITAFSYFPIRWLMYMGIGIMLATLGGVSWLARAVISGAAVDGWTVVLVAVCLAAGLQLVMLGLLGEYVWRALDETRRRPPYLIEARTPALAAPRETVKPWPDAR